MKLLEPVCRISCSTSVTLRLVTFGVNIGGVSGSGGFGWFRLPHGIRSHERSCLSRRLSTADTATSTGVMEFWSNMSRCNASALGRGGRVVDGSGLENRQGASPRGFESHPLRRLDRRTSDPRQVYVQSIRLIRQSVCRRELLQKQNFFWPEHENRLFFARVVLWLPVCVANRDGRASRLGRDVRLCQLLRATTTRNQLPLRYHHHE